MVGSNIKEGIGGVMVNPYIKDGKVVRHLLILLLRLDEGDIRDSCGEARGCRLG